MKSRLNIVQKIFDLKSEVEILKKSKFGFSAFSKNEIDEKIKILEGKIEILYWIIQ